MSGHRCDDVRARLPHWAAGRLEGDDALLRSHLDRCEECRAEAETVRLVLQARPEPPPGAAAAVTRAVLRDRLGRRARPWWGLAAAAVAVLALGIGIASNETPEGLPGVPAYAAEADVASSWMTDDGEVAGMASLEGLSEEALLTLLEELGSGGAA